VCGVGELYHSPLKRTLSGSQPTPIGNLLKEIVHYQECLPLSQDLFFNPSQIVSNSKLV
jgi:hypothetical protein